MCFTEASRQAECGTFRASASEGEVQMLRGRNFIHHEIQAVLGNEAPRSGQEPLSSFHTEALPCATVMLARSESPPSITGLLQWWGNMASFSVLFQSQYFFLEVEIFVPSFYRFSNKDLCQ